MVRTIFVTGGNQGLGMHAVHQLGSTPDVVVFMGSRKIAAGKDALSKFAADIHPSSTVVPVQLDITDAASIAAAHAFVADFLKNKGIPSLDVLVNNAAINAATFQETYATNVFGVVSVTEAFRPLLSNSTGGAILNISSGIGSMGLHSQRTFTFIPAYASSKAALNMLTVQWAQREREAKSGIRVVSICPGHNTTNLSKYTGVMSPAEGCKVIVKAALETEGRSGVFIHKDGDYPW
ncbi:hypothetical protein B0H12DRAFT_1322819 [Mycena haematopus]|nr:hypothetical protein B0H12DRAFT_1322819 [Mycena haematopus]